MIQNRSSADRIVSGSMSGEEIQMGVADIAHILNVVTDLYSDRELAPIREYSTNARDAHIAARQSQIESLESDIEAADKRGWNAAKQVGELEALRSTPIPPIEVTTPSMMSPFLVIQDYGIGMSLEDIRITYSQYGASTKRETNDQNGCLGLGCKSALTYADQFTVTSVKDGVRIQVVVSRSARGATMKVVDTSTTSEGNGTTVAIPARAGSMDRKARNFFQHWRPGTVLLNGVEPEFMPNVKWISDEIALTDGYDNFVVMGNVAYPAEIAHGLGYGKAITAFVPMGAVDFSPSRESLMNTDETEATLSKIAVDVKTKMTQAIVDDIESAESPVQAARRFQEWKRKVSGQFMPMRPTYKGVAIPETLDAPKGSLEAARTSRRMSSNSEIDRPISLPQAMRAMWVVNWPHTGITATMKKKLLHLIDTTDSITEDTQFYIFSPEMPADLTYLSESTILEWEDVKAVKLPRKAPNPRTGRIPGAYDIYEDGDYNSNTPAEDIDTSKPIFYVLGKSYQNRYRAKALAASYPGSTMVVLTQSRLAKFKRNFPSALNGEVELKTAFDKWKAGVSNKDAEALAIQQDYSFEDFDHLKLDRVDDPEVKALAKIRKRDLSKLKQEISEWSELGFYFLTPDPGDVNPLEKYTLFPQGYLYRSTDMEPIYRYMNAEYAFQVAAGK